MKEIFRRSNERLVVAIRGLYKRSKGRCIVPPFSSRLTRICGSGGCCCLESVVVLVVVIVVAVVAIGFFGFVSLVGVRSSTGSDGGLGKGCYHCLVVLLFFRVRSRSINCSVIVVRRRSSVCSVRVAVGSGCDPFWKLGVVM